MNLLKDNKQNKFIFFLLTLIFGTFMLLPLLEYHSMLTQGDHGLHYYAYQQTSKGFVPIKDYWWIYGPLTPYYYGIFIKIFGDTMLSVLLGRLVLLLASGLLCYLIITVYFPPLLGFAAALWFWSFHPDFVHSYNHTAAITLFFLTSYYLVNYIKAQNVKYVYYALFCSLFIIFVKLNIGVAMFAGVVASVVYIELMARRTALFKNKRLLLTAFILIPGISMTLYWLIIKDLPFYAIKQCFPYFDKWYYSPSFFSKLQDYTWLLSENFRVDGFHLAIVFMTIILWFYLLFSLRNSNRSETKPIFIILGTWALLLLCVSHEFVLGVHTYRYIWMKPFQYLMFFFVLGFASINFSRGVRSIIYFSLIIVAVFTMSAQHSDIRENMNMERYFSHPKAEVYVNNDPVWIPTVTDTLDYLDKNLKEGETFLVLPSAPIYYYLTERPSPIWELIITKTTFIHPDQEKKIIRQLKEKNVNWVVISNRLVTEDVQFGTIGRDYCPLLAGYIDKNYQAVREFGPWTERAGWFTRHATRILKRKAGP